MTSTSPVEPDGTLTFGRHFTKSFGGESPFDRVEWVTMDAWPDNPAYFVGKIRTPKFWTQNQLNIVSKLYLSKSETTPELDVQKMFERVAQQITFQAIKAGYFGQKLAKDHAGAVDDSASRATHIELLLLRDRESPAAVFYDELCFLLLNGYGAFNSPVWFNVGRDDRDQQVSACFILGAEDHTESLLGNTIREVNIFRGGSGAGKSVGKIRGSKERLSGGGTASGPVSFMRADDAWAGTIKSGGKTRRAAKLVCLPADHPDVMDFVTAKSREEDRLRILRDNGLNVGFDAEGERNVAEVTSFQNANNSVTVTDDFMDLATNERQEKIGENWQLINRADGSVADAINASDLLDEISKAAWNCACPGLQYADTMNRMHTTPVLDGQPSPINSTNPCGEYMSNDDTSCNLASLNLMKFFDRQADGNFRSSDFTAAVEIFATAMDILVEFAYYPDEKIAFNTRRLRQLGLGYANMGAIIMANGWAYDSEEARDYAAAITSLMTGVAYHQSTVMAQAVAPFERFHENADSMWNVIEKHVESAKLFYEGLSHLSRATPIATDAATVWVDTQENGIRYGYRNAQATVIAPTGTISFLMACDTTGIEPGFDLVQYKELAGGGSMILVNGSVHEGLRSLGYDSETIEMLEATLKDPAAGTQVFMGVIKTEEVPVFAGAGEISPKGHIDMMAAVQPFVSGAISKTINMDESATVDDIRWAYVYAWQRGVKDLAIYRNNSKARQVISTAPKAVEPVVVNISNQTVEADPEVVAKRIYDRYRAGTSSVALPSEDFGPEEPVEVKMTRERMPRTRQSVTHKIHIKSSLGENEGYITVGRYPDGRPGEVFLEGFGKHGGFTQNVLSALATSISIGLQYGIPLDIFTKKLSWVSDETGGMVVPGDEPRSINEAKSIVDYISRWLIGEFGTIDQAEDHGVMTPGVKARKAAELDRQYEFIESEPDDKPSMVLNSVSLDTNGTLSAAVMMTPSTAGDGPACPECSTRMKRTGSCHTCPSCGTTTGCG